MRERRELEGEREVDEHLYEVVLQAQRERIEEQRSELGGRHKEDDINEAEEDLPLTIPEDDISDLVRRMQIGRIEEQRAALKPPEGVANNATL